MVPAADMADTVASEAEPQVACERLVRAANDAGGLDNVTVVVVALEPAAFRP
jgi:serine/threonine protein phosphatase PrpC